MPVLDPAEEGRGGGYAHTMFVKEPVTKDFPVFFLQCLAGINGWKRTEFLHFLVYSNFYCKYIHSRVPAYNTIQMGRALVSFLSSLE